MKGHTMFMDRKTMLTMSVLPKLIQRFKVQMQMSRTVKALLKIKVGRFMLWDIKTYYKTIEIQTDNGTVRDK